MLHRRGLGSTWNMCNTWSDVHHYEATTAILLTFKGEMVQGAAILQ